MWAITRNESVDILKNGCIIKSRVCGSGGVLQGLQRVFDLCKLQAVIRQVAVKTIVGQMVMHKSK
jgi:hypothetical protein